VERNVEIVTDNEGKKLVKINAILVAKAKANASQGIPEMVDSWAVLCVVVI